MQQASSHPQNEYVDFWNDLLVPKFSRFKHILVGGLTHHSARIFPTLPVREGDRVVDVGCGFGDTAIELARRVGSTGEVLGLDCCEAFLDYGRRDAAAEGITNVRFAVADVQTYPCQTHASLKLHSVLRHRPSPWKIKRYQFATPTGSQAEPRG